MMSWEAQRSVSSFELSITNCKPNPSFSHTPQQSASEHMRAAMEELILPSHPSHKTGTVQPTEQQQVSKYIWFRIGKNLDIEPETLTTTIDKHQNHHQYVSEYQPCLCGCGGYEKEEAYDDDEEFLSAYESGKSSASSFAFPVLDARWSGSPVQMPHRKFDEHKKLGLLRKPKLAERFVCRWCRSF